MKILVVDDEKMILDLTRRILERAGFEVETIDSGIEATRLFRSSHENISLAIIDFSLGDKPGTEVIEEVRKIQPELPVIVSSGHILHPSDLPSQVQDNVTFLQKPYRANTLIEQVQLALNSKRAAH